MAGKLDTYKRKRDFSKTAEPADGAPKRRTKLPRFVIQEHHATALHWDLRLERDGVGVSWAVPKGLPQDPKAKGLAVHTEDHPLSYFSFEGDIPRGEYGGGHVSIWDSGTYEVLEWADDKVKFRLHGKRADGEYVLIQTGGRDGRQWLIRKLDAAPPDWEPMPDNVVPMLATTAGAAPRGDGWAYEFKWDGVRAIAYVDGGRVRLMSRNTLDISPRYPELRELGLAVGSTRLVLDGEVVAFDEDGRPNFGRLQNRMHVTGEAKVRRLMKEVPIAYLIFDVLYLDGKSTMALPYSERRELLKKLKLKGPHWDTPDHYVDDGPAIIAASKAQQLEGVMAKRLDSAYVPGKRSDTWRKIKNIRRQEVVIGGWTQGEGAREGQLGALLIGVYDDEGVFRYAGNVGTGFTAKTLVELAAALKPLKRKDSPFANAVPKMHAKTATYVEPELVCEVEFTEWTGDGKLRHPSYKGVRDDKPARDVIRETHQ
ncbi:MAG: non-homologous end-joining DNA ligase [Mycobacteriales bacterium]